MKPFAYGIVALTVMLVGCSKTPEPLITPQATPPAPFQAAPLQADPHQRATSVPIHVTTTTKARLFSLDLPFRCSVDWTDQDLVTALPTPQTGFRLTRLDKGDPFPRYNVTNFSFENMGVDRVYRKLLQSQDIQVYAPEGPYDSISSKLIEGNLNDVVELIGETAGVYYDYDSRIKRLYLKRTAKWSLQVPSSKEVIIGILDALQGANVTNIVVDWADKTLTFKGDKFTEEKVRALLKQLSLEKTLVAYDADVYRIYPPQGQELNWMEIIPAFAPDTVKSSIPGIIGRTLVVGGNFNQTSLSDFLKTRADVKLISRGRFILPERWQGRFDIGRCGREKTLETDLRILTEARIRGDKDERIDTKLVLRTAQGFVADYDVTTRLGDNLLVIGIPTHYFNQQNQASPEGPIPANAELVILLTPRLIRLL